MNLLIKIKAKFENKKIIQIQGGSNVNFFIQTQVLNHLSSVQIKQIKYQLNNAWEDQLGVGERQIFRVAKEFRDGERLDHVRVEGSGRPFSAINEESINVIKDLVDEDNHLSLNALNEMTGISRTTIQRILKDHLLKISICAKWVPHQLTKSIQNNRIKGAQNLLAKFNKRVFVIDEKWIYKDPLPPKQNIRSWIDADGTRSTAVNRKIDNKKFLIIVAINFKGDYYYQVLNHNEIINAQRYTQFLQKFINFFKNETLSIQHDNARPHKANLTKEFLEKNKVKVIDQPAYSPDTNLLDRYIFRNMEAKRRDITFEDKTHVFNLISDYFEEINEKSLSNEYENFKNDLIKIKDSDGNYLL